MDYFALLFFKLYENQLSRSNTLCDDHITRKDVGFPGDSTAINSCFVTFAHLGNIFFNDDNDNPLTYPSLHGCSKHDHD